MMKTEFDLTENDYILFKLRISKIYTSINIDLINDKETIGAIQIIKRTNFYDVDWVETKHNYGPLIYDLAMEYSSLSTLGLTAAIETETNENAYNIWFNYFYNRKDVSKIKIKNNNLLNCIYNKKPTRLQYLFQQNKLKFNLSL